MRVWPVLALALAIAAPAAAQVTVAVLDSGVDPDHPELAGRVERRSFASPVGLPLPLPIDPGLAAEDPDGQGTGVASVVAGATLGVAPSARVLDLQVSPSYTGTQLDPPAEAAAIAAMDHLLRNHGGPGSAGPRVALLSFAQQGVSDDGAGTLASQAQALWEAGVAVVVPASGPLSALQASPHVLTVAASESCAPGADQADLPPKPDLVAPSQGVEAAAPGTPLDPGPTTTASGSAYAAAQVAGAVARMWDARADLPLQAVYDLLRATAGDAGEPGFDACSGFGTLDVEGAEAAARAWTDRRDDAAKKSAPGPGFAWGLASVLLAARRRGR